MKRSANVIVADDLVIVAVKRESIQCDLLKSLTNYGTVEGIAMNYTWCWKIVSFSTEL